MTVLRRSLLLTSRNGYYVYLSKSRPLIVNLSFFLHLGCDDSEREGLQSIKDYGVC